MSAPFTVHYGHGYTKVLPTLGEAIAFAQGRDDFARILGDSADYDCDQDGYYMCHDGLSDSERDAVEEAGLV